MADRIVKFVSVNSETLGPDKVIVDYNQVVNQGISVALGTTIGLALDQLIKND